MNYNDYNNNNNDYNYNNDNNNNGNDNDNSNDNYCVINILFLDELYIIHPKRSSIPGLISKDPSKIHCLRPLSRSSLKRPSKAGPKYKKDPIRSPTSGHLAEGP